MDNKGTVIITIKNVASVGLTGTTEIRHLNAELKEHKDYIWGHIRARSRYVLTANLGEDDRYPKYGWLEETTRDMGIWAHW
ncbi:hypothetical protein ACMFMG_011370 [Clarireedia jacksonii]